MKDIKSIPVFISEWDNPCGRFSSEKGNFEIEIVSQSFNVQCALTHLCEGGVAGHWPLGGWHYFFSSVNVQNATRHVTRRSAHRAIVVQFSAQISGRRSLQMNLAAIAYTSVGMWQKQSRRNLACWIFLYAISDAINRAHQIFYAYLVNLFFNNLRRCIILAMRTNFCAHQRSYS